MKTLPQGKKFLLCRPLGGFNDVLSQIERAWQYSEKYNRFLIIDFYENPFMEAVFSLVRPKSSRNVLISPSPQIIAELDKLDTYPEELTHRLTQYSAVRITGRPRRENYDSETGVRLGFDFRQDYEQSVLVDQGGGSANRSFEGIQRFQVKESTLSEIDRLSGFLPTSYAAVHIRASDYSTDYPDLLERVSAKVRRKPILLCTDNRAVIDWAVANLVHHNVLSFEPPAVESGKPIHRTVATLGEDAMRQSALQLLAELRAIAKADVFFYTHVKQKSSRLRQLFSGLSLLMAFLAQTRGSTFFTHQVPTPPDRRRARYIARPRERYGHLLFLKTTALRRVLRLKRSKRKKEVT